MKLSPACMNVSSAVICATGPTPPRASSQRRRVVEVAVRLARRPRASPPCTRRRSRRVADPRVDRPGCRVKSCTVFADLNWNDVDWKIGTARAWLSLSSCETRGATRAVETRGCIHQDDERDAQPTRGRAPCGRGARSSRSPPRPPCGRARLPELTLDDRAEERHANHEVSASYFRSGYLIQTRIQLCVRDGGSAAHSSSYRRGRRRGALRGQRRA